jgi:hypothetical protein
MSDDGTVQVVLRTAADVLSPLERELEPATARTTFAQIGIDMTAAQATSIAVPLASVVANVRDLLRLSAELTTAIEADDTGAILAKSVGTIEKLAGAIAGIDSLVTAVNGLGLAIPQATVNAIPERLVNLMIVRALDKAAGVNELLELLGALERTQIPPAVATDPPVTVSTLHFDRFADWLESPAGVLRTLYGWDDPGFTGVALLDRLGALLAALGAPVFFDATATPPTLDIVVVQLVPKTDVAPRGLSLRLRSDFNTGTIVFASDDWRVELELGFTLPFTTEVVIQPTGLTFVPPAASGTVAGNATVRYIADRTNAADGYVLLGQPGGSRLEVRRLMLELGGDFTWDGTQARGGFGVEGDVSGGRLAVSFTEADGFIGKLLSGVQLNSDFAFGIGYSTANGLFFHGSSTLAIQLPLHLDLGPVEISALTFEVGIQGQTFPTSIAANIKAALGPVQAVVEQIGLRVDFALVDDRSGNAGPIDVALGFKPPTGAGLSIDAAIVKGGGYLYFDPDKGEYAGVAELSIAELVTVKAIALITTKMPDGSDGFSLLVIISAEFTVQLGFGFTLNGVGGLLGLNRTVRLDALRDGVRTGAIESIMFPTDIVANAPKIISDLRVIFPPEQGTFLIGPMAKLGWGTPSLITLSLGVIVEIPPGNIALIGVLAVVLPDEDAALIQLKVNFAGILDLEKQMLSFDASLFESRIVFITLEGDMAVRLKWGDNAGFLMSVGGFHPSFQPSPAFNLPALRRISVSILDYDWARIRIENYFAVTSNTVQFGALAQLFFGVDGCKVSGHIGFDVLFQFSPFYFNAQISGSLSVQVIGIDLLSIRLRFTLEGPSPYRAHGTGSVSLLFWDIDVDFDVTWGEQENTSLPGVNVLPIFAAEIRKRDNWQALPPPSGHLVTVRELDPALEVLHPFGELRVTQRALPLALTLDKVGAQVPDDVNRVDIKSAVSGTTNLPLNGVDDLFAAAQFQAMSDAEKLSRPSYQPLKAGVTIGVAGGPRSSRMTRRRIEYQVTIIDKEPVRPVLKVKAAAGLFTAFLSGAAVAKSTLSHHAKTQLDPYDEKVAVAHDGFAIASTMDNTPLAGVTSFSSEAMARDALTQQLADDPSLAGTLHVLPAFEVNA